MASISAQDFCAAVYCALASHDAFPVVAQPRIAFTAQTTVRGVTREYGIEFLGVSSLRWAPPLPPGEAPYPAGDKIELSVIELTGRPGAWRVWSNPWYTREIELECATVRLNGADVTGQGRFFQDDLPKSEPVVPPFVPGAA